MVLDLSFGMRRCVVLLIREFPPSLEEMWDVMCFLRERWKVKVTLSWISDSHMRFLGRRKGNNQLLVRKSFGS